MFPLIEDEDSASNDCNCHVGTGLHCHAVGTGLHCHAVAADPTRRGHAVMYGYLAWRMRARLSAAATSLKSDLA